jgi:hypothetical protein
MIRTRERHTATVAIHLAVTMLAGVSFVTTVAGVLSLAPIEESTEAALWWALAVLLAGGLAVAIGAISVMLFERVTLPRLAAAVTLATVAMIFDASFWQQQYLRALADSTGDRIEREARWQEYARLTREASAIVGGIRTGLEERHLAAAQGEGQALDRKRYEEKLRPEDNLRYCGRQCLAAQEAATRFRAEIDQIERQQRILAGVATTPASDEWRDLDGFHAGLATLMRDIPSELALPAPPTRPALLTKGGNAAGVGGLSALAEMLLAGKLSHQLMLPLTLAAISEYTVIILVLGARPWRPSRLWFHEKVEHVEESLDHLSRAARIGRRERNHRRHQHEMLEEELADLGEQISLRTRANGTWRREGTSSTNANGHDRHAAATAHARNEHATPTQKEGSHGRSEG